MRKVSRSALVAYSVGEMFSLVDDIEAYPEFLPWCRDAVVHFRQENVVEATLELHRGSVSKHFRTRNTSRAGQEIDIELVGGPFRHLSGGWKFTQLGDAGCKVALELEFEFANRVVDLMFGSFFEEICNTLIDAFTRRADVTFGESRGGIE
ncbi:MAG: type II toxin-antitoxin system RatA family toxin [Proteobacteria bacterium]|nr:type II toxin-antitoxin system RatA family toxin [Pseudomonadota bacterium]